MKKIFAIFLILAMLMVVACFAGCQPSNPTADENKPEETKNVGNAEQNGSSSAMIFVIIGAVAVVVVVLVVVFVIKAKKSPKK